MLQIIKDALYPYLQQYPQCPDFIAETVLQSIEGGNEFGQGMLPPFSHYIFYKTWRDGGEGYEWDPEDGSDK